MTDQDNSSTDSNGEQSGLYEKYDVRKDGESVENCFVLEPESDPAARQALWEYASATDDSELENDIKTLLLNTTGSVDGGDDA